MSYIKIEELLEQNLDYVEYDNKKYELDTSMQVLIKYNNLLEIYHKNLPKLKTEKEQKEALENLGVKISELLFLNKNDLDELLKKLNFLTPKKQDLVWKEIFKTWLNAMSIEVEPAKNQKKNHNPLI